MPLWRWIVVDDYSKESSFVIVLFSHSISDGVNFTAFLRLISDNGSDTKTIKSIKGGTKSSLLQELAIPVLMLLNGLKVSAFLLSRRSVSSALKK